MWPQIYDICNTLVPVWVCRGGGPLWRWGSAAVRRWGGELAPQGARGRARRAGGTLSALPGVGRRAGRAAPAAAALAAGGGGWPSLLPADS